MLHCSILIPGNWRDGWIYKESLYLLDRSGVFFHTPVERIIQRVELIYGPAATFLVEATIFRSGDWKPGAIFKRACAVPSTYHEFAQVPNIVIDADILRPLPRLSVDSYVYDLEFYANRLYMASEEGLIEAYVPSRRPADAESPHVGRLGEVQGVAAGYGMLLASAGEDGLLQGPIYFGEDAPPASADENLRRADTHSDEAEFSGYSVINYKTDERGSGAAILRSQTQLETVTQASYPSYRVTHLERPADLDAVASEALKGRKKVKVSEGRTGDPKGRVVANSKNKLLVALEGNIGVLQVNHAGPGATHDLDISPNSLWKNEIAKGQLASFVDKADSIVGIRSGFLVEEERQVTCFTAKGSLPLVNEPVGTIRTFPRAYRVNDTVLMTVSGGCLLVGFH